jgi:hypothetical protein
MPSFVPTKRLYPVVGLIVPLLLAAAGCERNTPGVSSVEEPTAVAEEPLLLEDEPLLLEDEPLLLDDEPYASSDQPGADNSRCFVCHANYLDEKIAVTHARAGIGCAKCHGPSDAHIADESWASGGSGTAPDVMFPRPEINSACMKCHPKDRIDTADHEPLFAPASEKVCTDCHGNHRLPVRRTTWK